MKELDFDIFQLLRVLIDDKILIDIFGVEENFNKEYLFDAILAQHPYCISFTAVKDNRFFGDAYTGNKGVALEFSKKELKDYLKSIGGYFSNDVIYELEEDNYYLKYIFDFFKKAKSERPSWNRYQDIIYATGCLVKHPYWKDENEFRAVFYKKSVDETVKENYNLKYNTTYKTQDYMEIYLPKELVKGITIGPTNSRENINDKILNHFEGKIKDSKGKDIVRNT
jgi:hypothetical protein